MSKFNLLVLAATTLTLAACSGKEEAQKVADALTVTPVPATQPNTPANPSVENWSGNGSLKMTGAPDSACATVTAEIAQDAGSFDLKKFNYECSGMNADMQEIRLDVRNGDLFMGADKVGTKLDNDVKFELHDPSGANLGFHFVTNGASMQLEHTMKANGFEESLSAILKR